VARVFIWLALCGTRIGFASVERKTPTRSRGARKLTGLQVARLVGLTVAIRKARECIY